MTDRRRLPLTARLGIVLLLLLVLAGVNRFYGASERELLLRLPEAAQAATSVELRVVRPGGAQLLRARVPKAAGGRSVVLRSKLPRGELRLEAWPEGAPPCEGSVVLDDRESVDVELTARR